MSLFFSFYFLYISVSVLLFFLRGLIVFFRFMRFVVLFINFQQAFVFFIFSNILVKYDVLVFFRVNVISFFGILYFDYSLGYLVFSVVLKILYLLLILKQMLFVIYGLDLFLILIFFYGTQILLNKVCYVYKTSFGLLNIVARWKGVDLMSCLKFFTFSFF